MSTKDILTEPTREQWGKLYKAVDVIKEIKPWNYLWDTDLVALLLPDEEEPVFCSIMGMGGHCYGVGIYRGYEQLSGFFRIVQSPELPSYVIRTYQNCYTLYLGSREELSAKDLRPIRELGLKYRGKNQWPYFRKHETGFSPWYINDVEAEFIENVLKNLAAAINFMLEENLDVDFAGGEILYRKYDKEKNKWENLAAPMPLVPLFSKKVFIEDELILQRLKKQERLKSQIEIAMFYLPVPVRDASVSRPFYPKIVLVADHISGSGLNQHLFDPQEKDPEILPGMLLEYITEFGLPETVYVRDDLTENYLSDICEKLNISLVVSPELPAVETMEADLIDYMLNQDERM